MPDARRRVLSPPLTTQRTATSVAPRSVAGCPPPRCTRRDKRVNPKPRLTPTQYSHLPSPRFTTLTHTHLPPPLPPLPSPSRSHTHTRTPRFPSHTLMHKHSKHAHTHTHTHISPPLACPRLPSLPLTHSHTHTLTLSLSQAHTDVHLAPLPSHPPCAPLPYPTTHTQTPPPYTLPQTLTPPQPPPPPSPSPSGLHPHPPQIAGPNKEVYWNLLSAFLQKQVSKNELDVQVPHLLGRAWQTGGYTRPLFRLTRAPFVGCIEWLSGFSEKNGHVELISGRVEAPAGKHCPLRL